MRKHLLLAIALIAIAFIFACNKQKPPILDYTEDMQKGMYTPYGLPGDGYVGRTPEEDKFHGYHGAESAKHEEKQPEEKQPEEKQPEEKQPEEKQPEEKQPEDEKTD